MRTFIAIESSKEIKKRILDLIAELEKIDKKIRWVRPKGIHLTLSFLGDIQEARIKEVTAVMQEVAANFRKFVIRLKGTGSFPPGRNPRVLWIGIEESKPLLTLQSRLEDELEKKGFPKEKRPFHPHLTLGRVKDASSIKDVLNYLDKLKTEDFGEMEVNKITLFKSTLLPQGAEYEVIVEFFLK